MITDKIDSELMKMAEDSDRELKEIYEKIDRVSFVNSDRILSSFIDNNVSYTDFAEINGYGNYDTGRDKLEKIFATVLGTEDSLVRSQIMSGTNAFFPADNSWQSLYHSAAPFRLVHSSMSVIPCVPLYDLHG